MKNTLKYWIYGIAAILIILGGLFLFITPAGSVLSPQEQTLTINVVALKAQDIEVTNEYIGYIIPIKSVDLMPNVSGYIDEVWAEGGKEVKIGDNLLMIDQREYKAQLDAAQAAVAQAQADFDNAKSFYNRNKKAGKKAVSASTLDQAKAQYLAAEANLKQAQAEAQKADVLYNYTVLQAPIDGIVGEVNLTKGNYVAPEGSALLSIIQYNPIRVQFAISDKEYLSEIKRHPNGTLFEGEKIQLRLADDTIYNVSGQFRYSDNQINKTTNSISIFADFANNDRLLTANSYVDVLLSRKLKDVYLVRQNYATLNNSGAFAYVMSGNHMQQIPLKIQGYYKDYFVVANKFEKDSYLVTDKIGKIAAGTKIKMKINNPSPEKE